MPGLEEIAREIYGEDYQKIVRSYDLIGDIAIIKIPEDLLDERRYILGEEMVRRHSYIKAVYRQASPVEGLFRVRRLEHLAGEERTLTLYKEYGCRFLVDVARVYFSPRLSYERRRISELVRPGETAVNMFAGVGTFTIQMARAGAKIHSIDINPYAVDLHVINNGLNKVGDRVYTYLGDAGEICREQGFRDVDRVVMPLPELALDYLPTALEIAGEGGWIHVYLHIAYTSDEEEALDKAVEKVRTRAEENGYMILEARAREVREVAPRTAQVVVDIRVSRPG